MALIRKRTQEVACVPEERLELLSETFELVYGRSNALTQTPNSALTCKHVFQQRLLFVQQSPRPASSSESFATGS
jgi:hypothetical protein